MIMCKLIILLLLITSCTKVTIVNYVDSPIKTEIKKQYNKQNEANYNKENAV